MSLQICSAVCKRTILTPCDEGAYSSAAEQLAGWTHSVIEYDQMLSDSFPIREVDDIVYEVDCKLIQTRWDVDVGAYSPIYPYKQTFNTVLGYWR